MIRAHLEPYFHPCKFDVVSFQRNREISVYFSETSDGVGQFWTLVPYLILVITCRRVNQILI